MIDDITSENEANIDINNPEFNESGKNKVKSICNARQALEIAVKLANNDRDRDIRRARVLAAFNGAAPYSESDLVNKAQAYRYNVSFGFMEGAVGRAIVPYNNLTVNVSDLTEIKANLPDDKLTIIQIEFGKIMDKWGKWPKFVSRLNQDLVLNGYNTAIFPTDYDPFPIFVAQKSGYVDEAVPNDVNDLEVFVWKKSYMIHELFLKISDPDIAKTAGWNVDNVRKALEGAMPDDPTRTGTTMSGQWTAIESAIRGASLFTAMVGAKMVNTFHIFAAELDGKVSHWIVLDNGLADKAGDNDEVGGIELFKKEERFDSMRDFLVYFDLETGDGTWHGSKGVGQRLFNTHKANDKMINSALDTTFTAGLVMLQPGDQLDQEQLQLTVLGPFAVIPNGVVVNPEVLPNVAPTFFQMQALLFGTSEQRVGDVVPTSAALIANQPETATAAKIKAGREALITSGNLKRYVDPISQVMSIIVRRLLIKNSPNPYAKEFQAELKRKGLTDDDIKEIKGARNTGKIEDVLGETAVNTQIIFAEFRGDPDVDQAKLKNMRIASVLDADAAEELLISDKDQTKQIESARLQELEITTILTGMKVPVSPRDNHEVHLQILLEWIGTRVQQQAQNFDPNVIPMLEALVEHARGHLEMLKADKSKKAIFKGMEERFNLSVKAIKDLKKQALELAKASADEAAKLAATPEEQAAVQQQLNQIEQQENSL